MKKITSENISVQSIDDARTTIIQVLENSVKKSSDDKKNYEEKLEKAKGADIYKYVLLINVSALEGYVAQARLQAQQSFNLSRFVAVAGFIIISFAIALSVYFTIAGNLNLNAAYLTGIAGVLLTRQINISKY